MQHAVSMRRHFFRLSKGDFPFVSGDFLQTDKERAMAPHVSRVRKEHLLGKLLAFLSCLTTGIRSVFNYIVQLFKWDGVDPTDYAAQDGKSSLLSTAGDDCNSPVSRTDLEVQFQQSDELIRAKFKSEIFASMYFLFIRKWKLETENRLLFGFPNAGVHCMDISRSLEFVQHILINSDCK